MHTAQTRTADRRSANALACAAGLVLLSLAACGAEGDDAAQDAVAQVYPSIDGGTPASRDGGVDAGPPPAYTATVTATGSGCAEGTYRANVGADGKITLSYDAFDVNVGQGISEAVKDCQLIVALTTQTGASYAITEYSHFGTAVLSEGVSGKQSSSYYFPNARFAGRLRNSVFDGPLRGLVTSEPLEPNDVQWTPCALQQSLRITNRLVLSSKDASGLGTLSFGSGEHAGQGAVLTLGVRACTVPAAPAAGN